MGGNYMIKQKSAFVTIDDQLCKGCSLCISVCPTDSLSLSKLANPKGYFSAVQHAPNACIGCNKCALMCPEIAIRVFFN